MRGQVVPFPHAARARPQGTAEQAAVSALDHGREGRCVLPGCLRPAGFKDFGRQGDPRDGVLRGGRSAVSPRGSQLRVPCRRLEPRPALPDQLAEPRGVARVQEVRRELRTQRGPDHQRQQDQLDRTRQRRAPGPLSGSSPGPRSRRARSMTMPRGRRSPVGWLWGGMARQYVVRKRAVEPGIGRRSPATAVRPTGRTGAATGWSRTNAPGGAGPFDGPAPEAGAHG